jgi:hypothetical protein
VPRWRIKQCSLIVGVGGGSSGDLVGDERVDADAGQNVDGAATAPRSPGRRARSQSASDRGALHGVSEEQTGA